MILYLFKILKEITLEIFRRLFDNKVLLSSVLAWAIAQLLKSIIMFVKTKYINFRALVSAGGMPSAHTAFSIALTTSIAINDGLNSDLFAIAICFTVIIMYDAIGVRRASEEHAKVLNRLINILPDDKIKLKKELNENIGHTPYEVFGGILVGLISALIIK